MNRRGKLHLYCGDGKGKTTAAYGLALRMAGVGGRVGILQFLKNEESGERTFLKHMDGIFLLPSVEVKKFVFEMAEEEKAALRAKQDATLCKAFDGCWDLLILDEALGALETQTLSYPLLCEQLSLRPESMEVVLTGRVAPPELMEEADYISEIIKRKHPYDNGVPARKGIEY